MLISVFFFLNLSDVWWLESMDAEMERGTIVTDADLYFPWRETL